MLPLCPTIDLGIMAIKGYNAFLKAAALLEPHHQISIVINRTLVEGVLPLCIMYSAVPSDWANRDWILLLLNLSSCWQRKN